MTAYSLVVDTSASARSAIVNIAVRLLTNRYFYVAIVAASLVATSVTALTHGGVLLADGPTFPPDPWPPTAI